MKHRITFGILTAALFLAPTAYAQDYLEAGRSAGPKEILILQFQISFVHMSIRHDQPR